MLIILSISLIILSLFLLKEIIIKPFPFLNIFYCNDKTWHLPPYLNKSYEPLNKAQIYIPSNVKDEIKKLIHQNDFKKIYWSVQYTRSLQRCSKGFYIKNLNNILSNKGKFKQICSESSKIFVTLMEIMNVPARVIWMNGHTTTEVFYKKNWVMIDAYGNIFAKNNKGKFLSVYDIVSSFSSCNFFKIIDEDLKEPRNYLDTNYLKNSQNPYAKQNLLLTIINNDLFELHVRVRSIWHIFISFFGLRDNSIGTGTQLVLKRYFVGNVGLRIFRRFDKL
jgi:hypothetical protein